MIDDQDATHQGKRFRLAVNMGAVPTEDSEFAIAEMIVIDGELNSKQIKCVEKQLSDKYDILNSATGCKPKNDSLTIQCGLKRETFAWYQGDNYDDIETIWFDDSGFCRNIDTEFVTGTITTENNLNNHQYLTGTASTRINFPYEILPLNYTLFHVAKYNGLAQDIIFQSYAYPFLSGFYNGFSGVAHHNQWITSSSTDSHGTNWVISHDQRSVYRSNAVPRMTDSQSESYKNNKYRLAINNGYYGTDDSSDWAVAEVMVFDYEMDASEYQCVEQYLAAKYDIPIANEVSCDAVSAFDRDILVECGVEHDIFSWYDGESFDFSENIWLDKSGYCRNVESEFISGTINIQDTNLNGKKYLKGTTASSMEFPHEVLPQDYTLFHVARYIDGGATGRIFQSFDYNWLSGFHQPGTSGVAYHENWLTPNIDYHGTDWIVSTDSRSLYRSNGVSRMIDNQSPGYHSNRYKLGLNTGKYVGSTYDSDWMVAEVIVFDKTLNPRQYKCMENYLSVKYDICLATYTTTSVLPNPTTTVQTTIYPTYEQCLSQQDLTLRDYECKSTDLTEDLYTQCELTEEDIFAWYTGSSYNSLLNQWFDKSGNCRNVKDSYISGVITTYNDLNGKQYLTGTTFTTLDFPYDVLPEEYTLFHMTRYFDGAEGRILQSYDYDWLSGFWNGYSGVARHQHWITSSSIDLHGREWVISTDQRSKYRSDGKTRTTNGQNVGYANNRYRLSINNGLWGAEDSDWAISEIIVAPKELNTKKIKCVENYLSAKYDETIYNSACQDNDTEITSLANQCGFSEDNLFSWFAGDSYDKATNIWYDKSANCRNIDSYFIDGTLNLQNDLNNRQYVNGSTSTIIQFPFEILPKDYTFMHVAKYQEDGTHSRIFQSNDFDWFSGFQYGGYSGISYHQNWITSSSTDYHGTGWVVSTDQRSLYRSNGVSRLTDRQSSSYANNRYELVINKGYTSAYKSDYSIAEILVWDEELSANQYKCVENYLSSKYDITIVEPSQCLENTDINTFQSQCNVLGEGLQPFAWYDGESYDFGDKLWQDKSGNCRNVESEHIEGNININSDLNEHKYLTGTTNSRMEFPYEILPQKYTFIHVAKWISTATGRIFNDFDYSWWSGFNEHYVMDVSANHGNWITPVPGTTAASYYKDWVISTDSRSLYRANGIFKMNNDMDVAHRDKRFRIGLNKGLHPTTDAKYGDWAVAEVLVFDRELEPVEYKCIEEYLSDKYNISISATDCNHQPDTITQQCGLQQPPYAWYSGNSFDPTKNTWFDNSKYCRNIDNEFITNSITHITNDPYDEMNGESYVTGTTTTRINYPFELLPQDYSFMHVARYYDGTEDIIFQAYDYHWFSGYYAGYAGVAHHEGQWITPAVDTYGRQWMISNDQRSLFRTNGIGRTTDTQPVGYLSNQYRLAVNQGYFGTDDPSTFAIAEVIIFNYELTSKEYKCVEEYLCTKYDKVCHNSQVLDFQQIDTENNNPILLTNHCPNIDTSNIVAWYNGDSYDPNENIWYDQSGLGRNIDSNYISGTIDIQSDFNNYKYINGSTSTSIDFPFDLLPLTYTFFHVAKYNNGVKDRIFQSHDFSWTSGFTNGFAGTSYHQNWITNYVDYHGTQWVLSTDQRNLYRSNGIDRMTNDQTEEYNNNRYILTVNNGLNGGEDSDFAISEIIIFQTELSVSEYKCVEEFLALKYNLCLPVPSTDILSTVDIETEIPSLSPTNITIYDHESTLGAMNGSCWENGLIKSLYWKNISNFLPKYDFSINVDETDTGINIELVTDYLGDSYDVNNNPIGTSYILDFVQFHSYNDKIENPGSCSNRLSSSYDNKTFDEYWEFSEYPSDINQLGNINYLSYGPLPSQWILTAETECTRIRYSGYFTWNELRNCVDYEDNKLIIIDSNNDWINMSGGFYVSVISPIAMTMDLGYYMEDLIISYPFQISIEKSIHILNNIGINVFLVTIFQSKRTVNGNGNNEGGYIIVLSSQTADYLQLNNPNLLTYPLQYDTWTIDSFKYDNGLNGTCYINAYDICVQFWVIEINNLTCPISFDGIFDIEWTPKCNSNNIDNTECNSYLNNSQNNIALSINMGYTDAFNCDIIDQIKIKYNGIMNFYETSSFISMDNNIIYKSNIDTIYIEIEITDLISDLTVNLLNVWICSVQNSNDILYIVPGDEMKSGCFDSLKISSNTFSTIIFNGIELLYHAQIYDTSSFGKNILRFSFITPNFVGVDTLYIHSEIELTLNNASVQRRMLLTQNSDSVYDFVHLSDNIQMDSSKIKHENEKQPLIKHWMYVIIIAISLALICVIVIAVIYALIIYINKHQSKYNALNKHVVEARNNNHNVAEEEFGDIFIETNQNTNEGVSDLIDGINQTLQHIDNNQDAEVNTDDVDVDINLFDDIDLNAYDDADLPTAIEIEYVE